MSWKFIFVVAVLIVGGIGYLLMNQTPEIPKEATYDAYTKRVVAQKEKTENVASVSNVLLVQDAVEKYKTMKGSAPAALQELVPEYIDHIPGGVQYDPATGTVSAIQ